MNEQLLPCPFCGEKADFEESIVWWVRCTECFGEAESSETIAGAAANWNRRTGALAGIKMLEWRRGYCDDRVTIEQASCGWLYQVRVLDGVIYLDLPGRLTLPRFETVDAAKAAAQKDFERRIRSASIALGGDHE